MREGKSTELATREQETLASSPSRAQLERERAHTIAVLSDAFAADLLDVDEFEERIDQAEGARDCQALTLLRRDLEVHTAAGSPRELARTRDDAKWVVSIMGGTERKGAWRVPAELRVCNLMGGTTLDFREAIFCAGISEVKVIAGMGGVDIIVPPDLPVECEGVGIMGAFENGGSTTPASWPVNPSPDQALLRIKGVALMGAVEIFTRYVGESARQARQRVRKERESARLRATEHASRLQAPKE